MKNINKSLLTINAEKLEVNIIGNFFLTLTAISLFALIYNHLHETKPAWLE